MVPTKKAKLKKIDKKWTNYTKGLQALYNLDKKPLNHLKYMIRKNGIEFWLGSLIFGLSLLFFQIMATRTMIALVIIGLSLYQLSLLKLDQIKTAGLIYYLPKTIQHLLLRRSVLDLLCDLWFIPNLTLYLKAIIGPLLNRDCDPQKVPLFLSHLEPHQKRFFITKGIAFLLPNEFTTYLLPSGTVKRIPKPKENEIDDSDYDSSIDRVMNDLNINLKPYCSQETDGMVIYNKAKSLESKKTLEDCKSTSEKIKKDKNIIDLLRTETLSSDLEDRKTIARQVIDHTDRTKSKVILSSRWRKRAQELPGRQDMTWDNFKLYIEKKKIRSKLDKKKAPILSSKLDLLTFLIDLRSAKFGEKVRKRTLFGLGTCSILALFVQLYFFKRYIEIL